MGIVQGVDRLFYSLLSLFVTGGLLIQAHMLVQVMVDLSPEFVAFLLEFF